MGYYASGSGSIDYARVLSEEEYGRALDALKDVFEVDGDREITDYSDEEHSVITSINFWHPYEKYYDDEVVKAITEASKIARVKQGCTTFDGEDAIHWQYSFQNGEWVEEPGQLVYNAKDIEYIANDYGLVAFPKDDPSRALEQFLKLEMKSRLEEIHEIQPTDELVDQLVKYFHENSDALFDYERIDNGIREVLEKNQIDPDDLCCHSVHGKCELTFGEEACMGTTEKKKRCTYCII